MIICAHAFVEAGAKTAEAIAAMGDCPDGKWELQGKQV
jgi:hypothetical protein